MMANKIKIKIENVRDFGVGVEVTYFIKQGNTKKGPFGRSFSKAQYKNEILAYLKLEAESVITEESLDIKDLETMKGQEFELDTIPTVGDAIKEATGEVVK